MFSSNCALSMPTMTALHEGHAKLLWKVSSELVGLPCEDVEDSGEESEDRSVIADDNDDGSSDLAVDYEMEDFVDNERTDH